MDFAYRPPNPMGRGQTWCRRCRCYNSLLGLCSFPHLVLSCYISFPGVPFLCLSSLSSYPGTPHIYHTHPLTPMLFLALLPDRGIPFAYCFLVMGTYSSSRFSRIGCILLLLILFSMTFHDILFLLSGTFYLVPPCSFAYSAYLFWSI